MTQHSDSLLDTTPEPHASLPSPVTPRSDDTRWMSVSLAPTTQRLGRFSIDTWRIAQLAPAKAEDAHQPQDDSPRSDFANHRTLALQLHLTERTDYRYNLRCDQPRLFVLCEEREDDGMQPRVVTACQEVASQWMDGDQLVLDTPMPPALMVWLEGYLARHGERVDEGKKKKRKGAGRASQSGQPLKHSPDAPQQADEKS
ncbi:DUF3305 domain-containing protein [Cobetia sp. L2A1]|uniref:DUF3305 domain-containing protein n=1 Tax=Cobetia sp. L2A1 TaxID=2686360 RepID=UPI001E55C325|nr:DUF3305 domain-containing protein [Cobetia sp. L2A1]